MKYFFILLLLIIISFTYLKLAVKYKIIDKPNKRSSHTKVTIRGGGILFTMAIVLFCLFHNLQYTYFFIGVLLVAIVSFLDDIYTLSAKVRFPFQLLAVALVLYQLELPLELIVLGYVFFGVGCINLFNFMDGINGITGFYALSVLSLFYFLNLQEEIINPQLIIYLLLSVLIFGYYNFRRKALFFAGDIGSVTLGVVFFFLIMTFATSFNAPIIVASIFVYGADASFTLLYRKIYTKESIFEPHRHHMYQKLVDKFKFSHLKVAAIYALIQFFINIIIYKTYTLKVSIQIIIFIILIVLFLSVYIMLFKKVKSYNA